MTSAQVSSCKFFQSLTLSKLDPGTVFFLKIFKKILAHIFMKNKTPAQMFYCKFWEMFQPTTLLRIRLWHRRFPVSFTKFLRTVFLQNICKGVLLMKWSLPDTFVSLLLIKMGNKAEIMAFQKCLCVFSMFLVSLKQGYFHSYIDMDKHKARFF